MQVVLRQHAAQQYGLQGFHPRFRRAVFLGNFFQSVVHFIQRLTGVVLHLREDQLPIITAFHFQRTGQAACRDQLLHQFGTDVNGVTDAGGWRAAAESLAAWTAKHSVAALAQATSDAQGEATFAALTPGLYLVGETRLVAGRQQYIGGAFLVALPGITDAGVWFYDVTAIEKVEEKPYKPPTPPDTTKPGETTEPTGTTASGATGTTAPDETTIPGEVTGTTEPEETTTPGGSTG